MVTRTPGSHADSATPTAAAPAPATAALYPVPALRPSRWLVLRVLHWLLPLWVLTPFGLAAWFVERHSPTDRIADPSGPCLWHMLTGVNGPGCGGTRMFYYLIHGNLIEAARFHLPALLAVPVLGYLWVGWAAGRFGVRLPRLRLPTWALLSYGVFFLVFTTVLRNIDWGPLGWFDIPDLTTRIW